MNRVLQRAVQCSWSAREHLHDLRAGHRHQLFQPLKRAAGALEHGQDVKETQGDSGWRYLSREGSSAGDQAGALSHTTAAGRKAGQTDRNAANVKAPVLLCRWTMMRWGQHYASIVSRRCRVTCPSDACSIAAAASSRSCLLSLE